jgi:hypothetical protein
MGESWMIWAAPWMTVSPFGRATAAGGDSIPMTAAIAVACRHAVP